MIPFPNKTYACILADPSWTFITRSPKGKGRSAEKHYGCMTIDDIKSLPVASLAAQDCALFLWSTDPMLLVGLEVLRVWGFAYKTIGFTWAKLNKTVDPLKTEGWRQGDFFTGMGYWTRANPEMCLLATRGHPQRLNKDVRRLLIAPRREHSRKPDQAYGRIEHLVGGPRIELFARTRRPGWDAWGNEVDKFVLQRESC